jgi:NADPH:quinone reductase-like Zn-dependent oxidoreductase
VGAFTAQLAVRLGARVTVTAVDRDEDYVRSLGVAEVLVSGDRGSHPEGLSPGSFDVVVDTVGGPLTDRSIACTRRGGVFVTLQQPPPADPLEALGVQGVFFVVRSTRAGLDRVRDSVERGQLKVTVAATFPLDEGRAAFESGGLPVRSPGKTVIVVRD